MKLKQIDDFQSVGFTPLHLKKNLSLSLVDAGRLCAHLVQHNYDCDMESILSVYQLKWTQDLEQFFAILSELPASFLAWASVKDLGLNELRILMYAHDHFSKDQVTKFLEKMVLLNPTRQVGARILEYYFELGNFDFESAQNAEDLLLGLYEKRFPQTANKDADFANKVQSFPWPSHVKAQWTRHGDKAGVEIKFFATSAEDFKKKVTALNDLKDKSEEKIWN